MIEINQHEVGTPKDYAHQIVLAFKNLKHGVSDFQGHGVMEDSEEEMMYHLIEEAISQALQAEKERLVSEIEKLDFYEWNEGTQRMIKDKLSLG